jgi:predicted secreted protein
MNYVSSGAAVCYDVTLTGGTATSYAFTVTSVNPTTCETGQAAIDVTKLPLGDTRLTTTTPAVGYLYACSAGSSGAGGASAKGPWFNADGVTWNLNAKDIVSGAVSWVSSFTASLSSSSKSISGNGLPSHTTGTYPIPKTDAIHQYDGNPNSIATQTINWGLPGNPQVAAKPSCTSQGAIGVLLTGVRLYNAVDGEGRDAKAWEGQDSCQGHPDSSGTYHYHSVSTCATKGDVAGSHSQLVGYAADGFAIFGNQGEDGVALTNANLDECHGHTHAITINGKTIVQYHYHATQEYPYSVGCFRGTAVTVH